MTAQNPLETHPPTFAAYVPHFLTISMTFIHRQLLGVSGSFRPIVLTSELEHQDVFRFPHPIYCAPRRRAESLLLKIQRRLSGRYTSIAPSQRASWASAIREMDARLIHAHFGPSGIEILPVAEKTHTPLVVTFHGYDASMLLRNSRYRRDLERLFRSAYVITVSRRMARQLEQYGARNDRMWHHYIGIPVDEFVGAPRRPIDEKITAGETVELLQVSNFVPKKGHEWTVRAFAGLLEHVPRCRLTLAGDGPLRPETEALARELELGEKIRFLGKVSKAQVIPLMRDADVFVHHSVTDDRGDQEGIPTVLMEAMATGLPVVSTDHSGISELIDHGDNGLLVSERDVPGYVMALREVMESGHTLGACAIAKIHRDFNMEKQNERLVEIYEQVLGNDARV